jgi:hypothetical protein
MKKFDTHITAVIDRSGSMAPLVADTIGGFNRFLDEQRRIPGSAAMSVYLFNHETMRLAENVPIEQVPPLSPSNYFAGGNTAYLDAIGQAIGETGAFLASLPESDRPRSVVVFVITDGEENASREFAKSDIRRMIEHQELVYNWKFIFLGANLDATAEAGALGVKAGRSAKIAFTGESVNYAYKKMSGNIGSYRISGNDADLDVTDIDIGETD